jgi:hypothetical protein
MEDSTMTEKKKPDVVVTEQVLPEAPASINFKGRTSKGWDVMFTLRDADEMILLDRFGKFVAVLEDTYHVSPTGKPNGNGHQPEPVQDLPDDDPSWCKIHNEQMKQWEKEGRVWYSHKVGDDWCKGK